MPSRPPFADLPDPEAFRLLDRLSSPESPRLSPADQVALVRSLRDRSQEMAANVDRSLLGQIHHLRDGLLEARGHLQELAQVFETLRFTPWHPAVFLRTVAIDAGAGALVACDGSLRVVSVAPDVATDTLRSGDAVLLGQAMNVILRRMDAPLVTTGDLVEFQRSLPDGRLVVRHRDEDVVIGVAHDLGTAALHEGDRLRWDRAGGLAVERVERIGAAAPFLEETPAERFDRIGGLDAQIARITRAIRLHRLHAGTARRYQLRRLSSVLLVGPPGTGKTLIARALANWLAGEAASGRARFMNVKPAQLHSMWYSESERQYREAFHLAREAGAADPDTPVVMFFDEVEAVGGVRGRSVMHVDDRVLTSFMTELDGLEGRGNVLVVAATNRRDMLDPALARPGRLGDLVLDVPRPGMAAAAAIFGKHLPESIPYAAAEDGLGDEMTSRQRTIDTAVARLYAPNGEGDVATVTFRDNTRRTLAPRDLISGAQIANIARAAIERACLREIDGGEPGVTPADVLEAMADELSAAVSALTPANCHAYVTDLPQDLSVVRVEPMTRRVRRPHRFLQVA